MSHQFAGSQEVPGLYETSASSASGSMSTYGSAGRMSSHQQRHHAPPQSYYVQPSPPRQYQAYRQQRHAPSSTDSVPSTGTPPTASPRGQQSPQMMANNSSSAPRGGSDPANDDPFSYPQDTQSWVSAPNPPSPSRIYAAAAAKLAERKNGYRRDYSRAQRGRGATEQQHLQQQRQQLNSSPISEPNFRTTSAASDVDVSRFARHVNRFTTHDPRTSSPSQQQRPRSKSSGNPSELGRTSGSVSERIRKYDTVPDYKYPDPDAVMLMSIDSESDRYSPEQPHILQQPHNVSSSSSGSSARVAGGQRFEGAAREATRSPREQSHRVRSPPPPPPATTPPSSSFSTRTTPPSSSFSTRIAKLRDIAEGVNGPHSVEEHRQPRSVEQHQRMRHRDANSLTPQRRAHHPNNSAMRGEPTTPRVQSSSNNKNYRVAGARSSSKSPIYMQESGNYPRRMGGDPRTRVQNSDSSPHRLGAVPRSHSRSPTDVEQVPLQKIDPYSASPPRDGERNLSNGSVDDSGIVSVETPSITSVTELKKRLWNEQERLQVAVQPSLPEHGDAHPKHWMHYNGPEMAGRRGQRTPPELPPAAPPVHHEHQRMSRSLSPDRPQYRRRSPDARQPQEAQSASGGGSLFKSRFYQAAMASQQGRGRPARQQQGQHEGKEMDGRRHFTDPRDQRSPRERAAANAPAPQSMRRSPPPPETQRNLRDRSNERARSISASEPGRQRPRPTKTAAHGPAPQSMWRSPPPSDPQGYARNETVEPAHALPTSEPRHQRPPPVAGGASSPAARSMLRSASPPEPRLNMSSSASNESSVAKLVAKLSAIDRKNPEAALQTIDSILRAETGSSGGPGSTRNSPSQFTRQASDVTPQQENRVPEHMPQHHNESEQHDSEQHGNEESSSEDSDDETSVSSITNPTFQSGKAASNQPASAPNVSTSAFRRPRPSALNAYANSAGKPEVRGKSSRKKGPAGPPPMATIKVSSTSKTPLSPIAAQKSDTGNEDGDEYSEDPVSHHCPICSAVVSLAVDRSDDERFFKCGSCPWNSKHSSPVVNAQSAGAVALKISRWQEMSQTDHRPPPREQRFGLSPSSSRSETANTEDLGSIVTPGDTGLGSILTPGDTADSDGLSSGRAHPWDKHHPGEIGQVTYDTSMTDGAGLEVVISDGFHGTPKTGFTGDRFDVDPQLMNSQGSVQSRGSPSIDTEQHQHKQTAMSDAFDDAWVSLPSSAFHPTKPRATVQRPRTTAQQPRTAPQNDFADWESQVKSAKPQQRKSPLPNGVTGAFDGKEDLLPTTPTSLISDAFAGKADLLPSTSNEDNSLSDSYGDMDGPPGQESWRDSGKKRKGLKSFLKRNNNASTPGSSNTASHSSSSHRKGRSLMSSYAVDSEGEDRAAANRRSKSKSPGRSKSKSPGRSGKKFWR